MPGGKPKRARCCCGCPDAPCDCELSDGILTCRKGDLQSTTIPGDVCAGAVVGGTSTALPTNVAWVAGEDTTISTSWNGFNITIPCGLSPLALTGVLVRRSPSPSGPSPYIDDDIVKPCEYYFVLYSEDGSTYSINYSYELCCGESEAAPPCQKRLSWIRFLDVPAGRGVYNFLFWGNSGPTIGGGNGVLVGECPFSDGPNPCL